MKKYSIIFVFFFCIVFSSAYSNVVVNGITNPTEMNGIYVKQQGNYGGKPFYEHIDYPNYCLYYEAGMMGGQWIISQIPGPWTMTMSIPDDYFYISSTGSETVPPSSGYSIYSPGMSMNPLTGNPTVGNSPVTPVSMWAVVFIFFAIGGFMIYRSYKRKQVA